MADKADKGTKDSKGDKKRSASKLFTQQAGPAHEQAVGPEFGPSKPDTATAPAVTSQPGESLPLPFVLSATEPPQPKLTVLPSVLPPALNVAGVRAAISGVAAAPATLPATPKSTAQILKEDEIQAKFLKYLRDKFGFDNVHQSGSEYKITIGRSGEIRITDSAIKLVEIEPDEAAKVALELVKMKGWSPTYLTGTEAFIKAALRYGMENDIEIQAAGWQRGLFDRLIADLKEQFPHLDRPATAPVVPTC